jgi:hypothetical protein
MLVTLARKVDREALRRSREAGIDLHLVEPIAPDRLQRFLSRFQGVVQDTEDVSPTI